MSKPDNSSGKKPSTRLDAEHVFRFDCSESIPCFTNCCRDITVVLTPYDVVRLKNALSMPSDQFLDKHTIIIPKQKRLIPMVILKMNESDKKCPFVGKGGCSVYADRPWPCRMYPLDINDDGTFGFITDESCCLGLQVDQRIRICDWLVEQGVPVYDEMNSLLSQLTAPLQAEELDIDNPKITRMTFMAMYNLDKFRDFILKSTFLDRFDVDGIRLEKIKRNDVELLKFGIDWIKFGVFGQKLFQVKESAVPKDREE